MRLIGVVLMGCLLLAGCSSAVGPTAGPFSALPATASPATPSDSPSPTNVPALQLVVLGDSIATGGEGADSTSYAVPYAAAIQELTGRAVQLKILADPSETSVSLLGRVRSSTTMRDRLAAADVIVITVGGNDGDPFATYPAGTCAPGGKEADCLAAYAPDLESNLDAILAEIETLRAGKPTAIRLTSPDYNSLIGLAQSPDLPPFAPELGLTFYRQIAAAETNVACAVASRHGAECVDFYHAFNGLDGTKDAASYLAADHLHPSPAGRDRIAELLIAQGLDLR